MIIELWKFMVMLKNRGPVEVRLRNVTAEFNPNKMLKKSPY